MQKMVNVPYHFGNFCQLVHKRTDRSFRKLQENNWKMKVVYHNQMFDVTENINPSPSH